MLERLNPILRLTCLALAALIVYQLSQLAFKRNALAHGSVSIAPIHLKEEKKETNASPADAKAPTNAPPTTAVVAVAPAPEPPPETSLPPGISLPPGVTLPPGAMAAMRSARSRAGGSNGPGGPMPTGPMGPMMRGGAGGGMPANLPPEIAAMVEKIKTSQILGPDIKPPPMALLGIAGKDVFLRAPNGQTGIIREGEELGGVKLIRVGTNRVIVEENKEQKELTIFNGFGSETLLKKDNK